MLRAVYRTGSSLFLKNCGDVDYVYYYDTAQERKKAVIRDKNDTADNHHKLYGNATSIILGCYVYPYMELVKGEEIPALKDFNLREHKEEYKELLKKYVPLMRNDDKRWYHILIAYYIFKENSWQEHLDEIQSVHDNGISADLRSKLEGYFKC